MIKCSICQNDTQNYSTYIIDSVITDVCNECPVKDALRVFKVPSGNMSVLDKKFAKLARRAKRINLPAPTYKELKTERKVSVVKNQDTFETEERVTLLHWITVDPGISTVKVNGWEFAATIQHTDEGNIIRKAGERGEIPHKYRGTSRYCDHCKTDRYRKDTYIVHNATTDEYKQVGRNCLSDFFGHDALMYAERAQYLADIANISDAMEDDMGFGGCGPKYDMLETYLGHVAECIKLEGWLSRTAARAAGKSNYATADVAMDHLHPPPKFKRIYSHVSEESRAVAEAAIEFATEIDSETDSEYLYNIRVIAHRGVVESRDMGLAASIVSAYQRHIKDLRMKELYAKRAETAAHVGEVGETIIIKLFVESVKQLDFDGYGYNTVRNLHTMSDKDGNVFVWFSSGETLPTGKEVVLKGTIKRHSEFRGLKQNVLSRCKQIEYKTYSCVIAGAKHTHAALNEKDFQKTIKETLDIKRWPKGVDVVEETPEESEVV